MVNLMNLYLVIQLLIFLIHLNLPCQELVERQEVCVIFTSLFLKTNRVFKQILKVYIFSNTLHFSHIIILLVNKNLLFRNILDFFF